MTELVDMYPTALDLTGLGAQLNPSLEGFSLAPLLKDPSLHERSPSSWKRAAFSQYPRCMNSTLASEPPFLATRDPCVGDHADQVTHMGYSTYLRLPFNLTVVKTPIYSSMETNHSRAAILLRINS
jgi:hypothetical protein